MGAIIAFRGILEERRDHYKNINRRCEGRKGQNRCALCHHVAAEIKVMSGPNCPNWA